MLLLGSSLMSMIFVSPSECVPALLLRKYVVDCTTGKSELLRESDNFQCKYFLNISNYFTTDKLIQNKTSDFFIRILGFFLKFETHLQFF